MKRGNRWKRTAEMFERQRDEAYKAYRAKVAETTTPVNHGDSAYLELADLRNQVEKWKGKWAGENRVREQLQSDLLHEKRSNASLRGTVTRMKPNNTVNFEVEQKLAEHIAKGHHKKHHSRG